MESSRCTSNYCPDFSDICCEDSTFWDFLGAGEKSKDITIETQDTEDSFWDFLDSSPANKPPENEEAIKLKENQTVSIQKLLETNSNLKVWVEKSENSVKEYNETVSSNALTLRSETYAACVSSEKEDEFWDFLKSDTSAWKNGKSPKAISLAELEEIKKITSLTTNSNPYSSRAAGFLKYNTRVPDSKKLHKNSGKSLHDGNSTCRDMDEILSEINSTLQELKKYTVNNEQIFTTQDSENVLNTGSNPTAGKSVAGNGNWINSLETRHEAINTEAEQRKKLSVNDEINLEVKETKLEALNKYTNVKQKFVGTKVATGIKQLNASSSEIQIISILERKERNNFTKHFTIKDSVKIADESTKLPSSLFHTQSKSSNNTNFSLDESKPQKLDQLKSEQFSVSQSGRETAMNLPIISSVFSIPYCSDILHQNEISTEERSTAEQNKGIPTKNISIDSTCPYWIPHQNTGPFVPNFERSAQQNMSSTSNDIKPENHNTFPDVSREQKNAKRILPQSSPQNSVFRITDCDSGANTQLYSEVQVPTNATRQKRQKISGTESKLNIVYPNTSDLKYSLKYQTRGPVKSAGIMRNDSQGINSAVSNSIPLYLIIPKNTESGKSVELVMIVNNNTAVNNSEIKNVSSIVKPTPFLSVTHGQNINTQISEKIQPAISKQQICLPTFQQMSVPTVNLVALKDDKLTTNETTYLQPTLICEPAYQRTQNHATNVIIVSSTSTNTMMNNTLSQSNIVSSTAVGSTNVIPRMCLTKAPCIINNIQPPNTITKMNMPSLDGHVELVSTTSRNMQQSNQIVNTLSQNRTTSLKPIKNTALGKDKDAIQQTSFPLKMENVFSPDICSRNQCVGSYLKSYSSATPATNFIATNINRIPLLQENNLAIKQEITPMTSTVTDFVYLQPKTDSILIKRDLITNPRETINKNIFFPLQNSCQLPILKSVNSQQNSDLSGKTVDNIETVLSNIDPSKQIVNSKMGIVKMDSPCKLKCESQELCNSDISKNFQKISKSQPIPISTKMGQQVSTLATLQELFPPPISMIPVFVSAIQSAPTSSKPAVSKVSVLHSTNPTLSVSKQKPASGSNASRKTYTKKIAMKVKKMGRKTVRELLQERRQNAGTDRQFKIYQPLPETKVLEPISKLPENSFLMPNATINISTETVRECAQDTSKLNTTVPINAKRPNIMILPSASKNIQENSSKEISCNNVIKHDNSAENSNLQEKPQLFKLPKDFLSFNSSNEERSTASKDFRPKHYDMCELSIGYFKVEDDVDACGRFRSKFKVLFTKRQFLYEFPVVNCNQVDLNSGNAWDLMARILVPFKTIAGIKMSKRNINIQVNSCPQVHLWKTLSKSTSISAAREPSKVSMDNSMWINALDNSYIHKITLRKRQADSLQVLLCQFEPKFLLLFSMKLGGNSIMNSSPYEEDLTKIYFTKVQPKNKRALLRRLPQWDSEDTYEPTIFLEEDPLVASNHVCSCRISCRSLRCSCVKAAKSCSTEGIICSCTNCDNPLNVLESFGLHLGFSLNDCCLFQNIYQISRLRNYLEREVKLSCCNTVARVLDCIPGTILCPNTDCNASLEFSWCRGIICYPDRNPRNHCSFCGRCCFSNGRHCPVCNRCYVVKPRSLNCPSCGANGVTEKPRLRDVNPRNMLSTESPRREHTLTKKPEIILLDKSVCADDNLLVEKLETTHRNSPLHTRGNIFLNNSEANKICLTSNNASEI